MKKFYNLVSNTDSADLYIYDAIGKDEFDNELSAKSFKDELFDLKGKTLNIHMNCPGGSVFEGNTIANLIKAYDGKTVAIIEGLCASIATQIALSCDEVQMYKNALFMIHRASCIVWGNSKDLIKQAQDLEIIDDVLAQTYADKTGLPMEEVLKYMDNETWFNSKQCEDLGFADSIIETDNKMVAKFDMNAIKNYKNTPKELLETKNKINDNSENEELENLKAKLKLELL